MEKTGFWKAVSVWLTAFLMFTFAIIAAAMIAAADNDKTVTKTAEFDSQSGCEDSTSIKPSGETESIKMTSGDKGVIELDDWTTLDLTFQARVENTGDQFVLTLEDEDDSANYIEITITGWSSNQQVKVEVDDHIEGSTASTDNTEDIGSGTGMVDTVVVVDIDIVETSKGTDGSKQQISVSVGGTDIIEDYELQSYELSTKTKERKLNDIITEVKVSGDIAYFDLYDAESSGGGGWGFNWTWIAIGTGLVVLSLVVIWKRQTVSKKLGEATDKISSKK